MPYIGQRPSKGDENNFKILDDISSYTLTFDGTDASVVSAANDTITSLNHRFVQGQRVTYHNGGGNNIGGLSGTAYFIIKEDHNTIKLASTASNASNGIAVNITGVASSGSSHTLNLTFDGTNTKFKATHTNGQKAKITRSAQLVISMNGVIQQPHDTATPSTGFGFDLDGTIVFSQAPISTDVFWAHVLTNNNVTFDISDNDIDNFTGNGSTVSFNLSKSPPDNRNVLVTLDGVVQYPNDPDGTARSYNVVENVLTFTTAPASGVEIQVRHIGFAGSTSGGGSGGVTSFYGRTGAVVLKSTDNITVNDAAITGNATVTGNLTVNGTTTTLDTQLVEVDKIEVETAGTNVAVAVTHNGTGDLIRLYDGTSQVVTVDDEGKVGIGTANPTQNLHILGSSTSTVLIRASTLNGTAKLQLQDSLGRDNFIAAEGADNLVFAADEGNAGAGSYMRFKVDGSEKVRITSAGSVGINTTVDAATKLQVQSDGTSTTVGGNIVARFQSNGSGRDATIQLSDNVAHSATISMLSSALVFEQSGTETLRIDSSGRVLIGTDSSLNQYGSQSHLQVAGTSYDSSTIALRREQNNANPPGIIFAKSRSGTLGGNTIVQDDDQIGSLIFTAADGNDLTTVGAQIKVEVDGTPASNNIPGRIVFQTGGTAASNERLRITSTGHLGVGDDSPDTRLSVKAASGTDVVGKFTSTDANAWIQFRDNTTTDTAVMVGANGDNLLFRAGSNTRVRIHSTGQVTIGAIAATSSASGILHTKVSNTTSPVVFENDTENADVVIRTTGSNKHSVLGFGDGADNFIGNIDYDHQNNAMVFDTNGGERLNISSAGVVTQVETGTGNGMGGIRASTASAGGNAGFGFITGGTQRFALVTIGSAGSEALRVYDNNNSAERLRINASGTVEMNQSGTNTNVTANDQGGPNIWLKNTSNTDGNYSKIGFFNSTGYITAFMAAQYQDAGDRNTDLVFGTRENGGILTQRLRITSTGQFHAGGGNSWTYASQKFVLVEPNNALGMLLQGNNANEGVNLTLQNIVNANNAYSSLSFADDGGQIFGVVRGKVIDKSANTGELQFWTSGSERFTIDKDGIVKISNTQPQVQFIDSDGTNQFTQVIQSGGVFFLDFRDNTNNGTLVLRGKGGGTATERLRINSAGRIKINHNQTPGQLDDTWLSIYDANSDNSAHDPAGISKNYAMIALHNYGTGNTGDVAGIAFGAASSFTYTKSSIAHERTGSYGTGDLVFLTNNDQDSTLVNSTDEKMRITRDGDIAITTRGSVEGVSKLNVEIPARTTAFSASDGDTWHDVLIENPGDAQTNAVGLCFQVTGQAYHKNAGTGIAAVKNGTASDYGSDLVFITRPQSAVAEERLRIRSDGNVVVGGTSLGQGGSFGMEPNGHIRSVLNPNNAGDTLLGAINGVSNGFQINIDSSNNQTYKFHNGSQDNLTLNSSGELIGTNSYRYVYPGNYADASKLARFMAPVNYASSVYWGGGNGSAVSSLSSANDTNTGGNYGSSGGSENNLGYADHPGLVPCSSVWRAQNNDTSSNFDGGWNKNITGLPGDDWGYLSTVMVRRVGSDTNGQFYHGCSGSHTLYQNGSAQTNPYFHSYFISTLPQDIWCLSIGVITGNGAGDNGDAASNTMVGTYRLDTGQKLNNGDWFRMKDGSTAQNHRVYLYYSTSSSAHLQFRQTGFYVMDGSEPSIAELSHGRLCFKAGTGIVPVEDA